MSSLQLYNTLSRKVEPVFAGDGERLRFYCCGPTVYGPAHIGNFRTFVVQDLFRRVVEMTGIPTFHVRNVTDVDDKTIRRSMEEGKPLGEFTAFWTERFEEDCRKLGMLDPAVVPSAVKHIPEQIELIKKLLDRGHAYEADDGSIYFNVSSFLAYGRLSRLQKRELRAGASGRANLSDEYEKDAVADFALWKAKKPEDGPNAWSSPWGPGRPGWHIECSAMSMKYLGPSFDLHSGGVDLCFPHHENEIAQSEGATGQTFVRHWFHVEHLRIDGRKMSKSLQNLFTLDDIEQRGFSPIELRYALLAGHYRQQLSFNFDSLRAARSALKKIGALSSRLDAKGAGLSQGDFESALPELLRDHEEWAFAEAWEALLEDLNVPKALGAFFGEFRAVEQELENEADEGRLGAIQRGLGRFLLALGIEGAAFLGKAKPVKAPAEVRNLAEERLRQKKARNFAEADALRERLEVMGWEIRDRPDGYDIVARDAGVDRG